MKGRKKDKDEPHSTHLWNPKILLSRFLHLDLDRRDDRNAYYLVVEVFWAAFLNAAASFNVAYALRLDATDQMVGYLSSIPALFAIFLSIPAGQWVQRTKNKNRLLITSLAVFRLGYVAVALVPWLNFLNIPDGSVVIILLILFAVTQRPMIIGFSPMMSEVLPVNKQAPVISARMQIMSAVQSVSVFLFGLWLDKIIFPLNYQLMYFFAFGLSIISTVLLARIERPKEKTESEPENAEKGKVPLKAKINDLVKVAKENPTLVKYMVNVLCMDFGMWVTSPLFSIYYINNMGASDGWLGTASALHNVAVIVGYSLWRPVVNRLGAMKLLQYAALLRPLWPLSIALAPNLTWILVIHGIWGLIVPSIGLSSQSAFLQVLPADAREAGQALHSTVQNASMFVSPLLGVAIAEVIGIPTTLLIFAGVRLLGSFMWTINPIMDRKQPASVISAGE
ncbi:MAG: MFS transporter [Anaerolineae bacterium]|jgi:predicted MFS family arabinose efflux permease|nr:MFS transporter [Anaerolineae bacterium]